MDTTDEVSVTCTVPLHCTADGRATAMAQPRPTLAGLRVAGLRVGLVPQSA
jgi:hypothetical protein